LRESLRRGVFAVVDFREQGLEGLRLVQEFRKDREVVYLALGRLDEFDEDHLMKLRELGDGYGLPSASAARRSFGLSGGLSPTSSGPPTSPRP